VQLTAAEQSSAQQGNSLAPPSNLAQRLAQGRFVITVEAVPPLSCEPEDLLGRLRPFAGLVDAVNLPDGAGAHVRMAALPAAVLLAGAGIEPILQVTCRDRNRIALQGDLIGAATLGLKNLLLLRGDDPTAGDQPQAKPVFDLDSRALVETARLIRDEGRLPHGAKVAGSAPFFIGVADTPIDPPPGWQPDALKAKVAAGAQFVQTQFCMDTGVVRRYVARLHDAGLAGRLYLLIGVTPLRSARSAAWMRQHLFGTIIPDAMVARLDATADPAAEGRRICVETIAELADIPGIAGAHVMAPGNEAALPEVIAAARAALPKTK
jgi:methylenetetrahydrofolate reductase (NADPH)